MTEIVSLALYRSKRKKQYMEQHRGRIDEFVQYFVGQNFLSNFEYVHSMYMSEKIEQNEQAWDYYDFRDVLEDAIHEAYGQKLWEETQLQRWFNPTFIDKEEMIERCLSTFVLGAAVAGLS